MSYLEINSLIIQRKQEDGFDFILKTDSGKFYTLFEKALFYTCQRSAGVNINFAV